VINRTEERDRHLAVHERHLAGLNAADAQDGRPEAGTGSHRRP
jgi:hypothetical protein